MGHNHQDFHYSGDEYSFQQASKKIGELLVEQNKLNPDQLTKALSIQTHSTQHKCISEILVELGYITELDFAAALAEQLSIRFINPENIKVAPEILARIPIQYAKEHLLLPISNEGNKLTVLMASPNDMQALQMLHFLTGNIIEPCISTPSAIKAAIAESYTHIEDEEILSKLSVESRHDILTEERALQLAKDKPTVRLVNNLLGDAIQRGASDIHIRPQEQTIEILYRIDGQLELMRNFPKSVLPAIISRLKVLGKMDITERRLPQDGRIRIKSDEATIDMRVSIMPSIYGESLVIRLLDSNEKALSLEDLGLSSEHARVINDLLSRNTGLILVTGPTGSGKSTTLYAGLLKVRERNINIITVEDPVEYRMKGITQIQVKESIGYTFERALRNILRHDPDAIMIGEMRDYETTKIAVESALTGHLVLSTLHTNDAASTITRLLEMGIEDYLIRSTLLAVIAQRLVRKNCPHCLVEEHPTEEQAAILNISTTEVYYRGEGCKACRNTGYKGRIAVYELIIMDADLRQHITEGVSSDHLEALARKHGMKTLTEQALVSARAKLISLEQVQLTRKI